MQAKTTLLISILLWLPSIVIAQGEHFNGYFIDEDGQTHIVEEFLLLHDTWRVEYDANEVAVPISEIKSITRVDNDVFILERRDERTFKVEGSLKTITQFSRSGGVRTSYYLAYSFYNDLTESYSEDRIHVGAVKKIVFDADFGELRRCPKDDKTFPPDFLFCPYDKTKLVLIQVQ